MSRSLPKQGGEMQRRDHHHPMSCSLPPSNQNSKKPSMASHAGAEDAGNDPVSSTPEDFEFCILSSGGLALAGEDAADMCAADEVFSGGKLLPFRLSSAASADAPPALLLLRSDSLDGAATAASTSGFSSRSVSRSASSSSSTSSCVSRSTSSKSASSDPASVASCPPPTSKGGSSADAAVVPPRQSLSSSVFYAHPSPSPRPPRRSARTAAAPVPTARRSTGSAPPASWGIIRLGVVGAPEVYAPRATGARGGSRSARFDQPRTATKEDKKLALGLLGAGLVCSCSPDAVVAPVGSAEVATAEARRRRKKAEEKKRAAKQSGQSTARRSRILEWLEELSISKEKSVVV